MMHEKQSQEKTTSFARLYMFKNKEKECTYLVLRNATDNKEPF